MAEVENSSRDSTGQMLFSYGFRPFFLFGAFWAALSMALWIAMLGGSVDLPGPYTPLEWHVHELLYGYVPAIVAGFLLTAVPNWTGRPPMIGRRLIVLFLIWITGRVVMLLSHWVGSIPAALLDLMFLLALAFLLTWEIVAAKNHRNLKVLVGVGLLWIGNALFHVEVLFLNGVEYSDRLGIGAITFLIMVIGGRIVPSFTRNWLKRQGEGRLPKPFDRFDLFAMGIGVAALICWGVFPENGETGYLALAAGLLQLGRLARWAGERTGAEALVFILHIAYFFVPLGFLLIGLSILVPDLISEPGALHSWTVGGIGCMTIAVMTRSSLGHTGRALTASPSISMIYLAIVFAAIARILAAFDVAYDAMIHLSGLFWILSFAGFCLVYAPMLSRKRVG